MKKIKTIKGSNLIIKYALKALAISAASVLFWSLIISYLCLKTDIDIEILSYASVFVCAATAAITGWLSVKGFKNNAFALGAISTLPLLTYSLINMLVHSTSGIILLVKIILCVIIGGFCGVASIRKSKRIKVR